MGLDVGIVAVHVVVVEEGRVTGGPLGDVERPDAEDAVEVDLGVARRLDGAALVETADPFPDAGDGVLPDKVDLVDDDAVGADDLVDGLAADAIVPNLVEMLFNVRGIDHRDDRVEAHLVEDRVVDEERLCHRHRIGESARLEEDVVDPVSAGHELAEDLEEVASYRGDAADASVGHLVDLLVGGNDELGIDVDLAGLVFDDGDPPAVFLAQNVVEERGLPGAEETGQDRDGNLRRAHAGPLAAAARLTASRIFW